MAHFIYEYSANLPVDLLDLQGLMEKMHSAAADTGVFPLTGIRSRAVRCDEFRIADGAPDKGFINLSMKVGHGRDEQTRLDCGRALFDTLVDHLQPLMDRQPVAVSFEMRELEAQVKFNRKSF